MNSTELEKYLSIKKVKLIAVSKTKPVAEILKVYETGQRDFAENKVQEIINKKKLLPPDIRWHLIGHLQTNKVKLIAPFIFLIHSVDSLKLLQEINKEAEKNNRTINYLLQVYVAKEETKFGLTPNEILELLQSKEFKSMNHCRLNGLMAMASNTANTNQIRSEFTVVKNLFSTIKEKYLSENQVKYFAELSMGMSGDFEIAIACGATMVRIGSLIFGER